MILFYIREGEFRIILDELTNSIEMKPKSDAKILEIAKILRDFREHEFRHMIEALKSKSISNPSDWVHALLYLYSNSEIDFDFDYKNKFDTLNKEEHIDYINDLDKKIIRNIKQLKRSKWKKSFFNLIRFSLSSIFVFLRTISFFVLHPAILINFFLFVILSFIVLYKALSNDYLNNQFFILGLYIEAFGILCFILIFGIFFNIFFRIIGTKKKIQNYMEQIDDFRNWKSEEAQFRIVGIIRRLNKLTTIPLKLFGCNLSKANLEMANLFRANLRETDLKEACLIRADLQWSNLNRADLTKTNFYLSNLEKADLQDANLAEANLELANFSGANFMNANLENAILRRSILLNAKNLKINQLSRVKTLYGASIDFELKLKLNKEYPHLFEQPSEPEYSQILKEKYSYLFKDKFEPLRYDKFCFSYIESILKNKLSQLDFRKKCKVNKVWE